MAKEKTTGSKGDSATEESPPVGFPMKRELIVVIGPKAGLKASKKDMRSVASVDLSSISDILDSKGATMRPLFGPSEERIKAKTTALSMVSSLPVPDLSVYYNVEAPDDELDGLAKSLMKTDQVEAAYVKPPGELPQILNNMLPQADEAPSTTPNFIARQIFLNAAPAGIDAQYAWTQPGGSGAGVKIIDCEWAWRYTHEDLIANQGGVVAGTQVNDLNSRNHGTAVIGVISADRNPFGITGICPDAIISSSSFSLPTASAIQQAADRLGPGDIMLLEIHRAGPRYNFQGRADQAGYIAIEWWPDDFNAIRYAISRGIIVVEAAGNGAENLDDAIYNVRPAGFPADWTNPFSRNNRDSGAVVVGAGAPPEGTHGRNNGPDRSRLSFSNYGSLIDAQGWGREVTTCGYGDLQGGSNEDLWYTDQFSGTSSASPIVVGALGCVQGVLKAMGRIPLSPARSRELLRATGSPQQDAPGRPATQRIGNRPNLRQLIPAALETGMWTGVQFRGTVPAGQTICWYTFNWPAHWHVFWTVVPTTVRSGAPQIKWKVKVERASDRFITYWICITNVSSASTEVEARYSVLGW
jgi:hypothetical protein